MVYPPVRIELPTVFGMNSVNAWLFPGPEPVLIDCGEKTDASWNTLSYALAKHNLRIEDLARVIITHAHVDHMGMAGKIAENSDAEIWVPEYAYDWAVSFEEMADRRTALIDEMVLQVVKDRESPVRKFFLSVFGNLGSVWDSIPEDRVRMFPMTGEMDFGGRTWEVLYTPGHCINQVCFFHRETGDILSADMLLSITPSPVIDPTLTAPYERVKALPQMLQSYADLLALPLSTVYPGHYDPFENAHEAINKQVSRIHERKEQCFDLIQSGTHGFMDLFTGMYKNPMNLPGFPMLVGYLDLLETEGRIRQDSAKGKYVVV